jgi:hypothetical protein
MSIRPAVAYSCRGPVSTTNFSGTGKDSTVPWDGALWIATRHFVPGYYQPVPPGRKALAYPGPRIKLAPMGGTPYLRRPAVPVRSGSRHFGDRSYIKHFNSEIDPDASTFDLSPKRLNRSRFFLLSGTTVDRSFLASCIVLVLVVVLVLELLPFLVKSASLGEQDQNEASEGDFAINSGNRSRERARWEK